MEHPVRIELTSNGQLNYIWADLDDIFLPLFQSSLLFDIPEILNF